jgi:hypothetical protein
VSLPSEQAKAILAENERVLYGIFGVVAGSGFFPPYEFLNEFFLVGHDPCDQDQRMSPWKPFALSRQEYEQVKIWWLDGHSGDQEDRLGANCWSEWVQELLG